jgi:hypothetical protein
VREPFAATDDAAGDGREDAAGDGEDSEDGEEVGVESGPFGSWDAAAEDWVTARRAP